MAKGKGSSSTKVKYRTRYVKVKPKRRKVSIFTKIKRFLSGFTDVAVYASGAAMTLNALDEGKPGSRRLTQNLAEKNWEGVRDSLKDAPNALKRWDFWLGLAVAPIYKAVKKILGCVRWAGA